MEKESSPPARNPSLEKEEEASVDDQNPNETEVESKEISENESPKDTLENGARSQSVEKSQEGQEIAENPSEALIQTEKLAASE